MISSGIPYRGSQFWTKALLQVSEDISWRGNASGHRLKQSTTVRRYLQPLEAGKGPTKSTWMLLNLEAAGGSIVIGDLVCRPTFEAWQAKQSRHHCLTSFCMSGQTKRDFISLTVGLVPPWLSPWCASKTDRRNAGGTNGWILPVETSHHNATLFHSIF